MLLGADYAWARPGGAVLAAAGVHAVGRYLATDGRGITAAEYQDLTAHGVGVWLVYEGSATGMLGGYGQGVADAQFALAQIAAQGLPADAPVYWAADYDIAPGSAAVAPSEAYVDGWNTIIPAGRRGGYGGLWFLNYIHGRGKADFLWECGSTSFRHGVDPSQVPLNLQQTTDTPPVAGTDYNVIFDLTSLAGAGPVTPIVPKWKEADMIYIYSTNRGGGIVSPTGFYPLNPTTEEAQVALATYGTTPAGFSDRQWDVARQTAINIGAQFAAQVAAQLKVDVNALAAALTPALVKALPAGTDTTVITSAVEAAIAAIPAQVVAAEGKKLSS